MKKPTADDALIIECLCNDEVFKNSREFTYGTIKRMYPDWDTGHLVYELLDGSFKESEIYSLLQQLKEINYMREFQH